jgi:hypothetical protein
MIRRNASEVLRSLEARVARLEGGRKIAAKTMNVFQLADFMVERYARWQHISRREVSEALADFLLAHFSEELDLETQGDVINIGASDIEINYAGESPLPQYSHLKYTVFADVILTNLLTGKRLNVEISLHTDEQGNPIFGEYMPNTNPLYGGDW